MKIRLLFAVVALSYAPLGVAGNNPNYPTEKIAEFVIQKLDVTSLPSVFRPKKEKGKKTLTDYGFTAQGVQENSAIMEGPSGGRRLSIKVLDQRRAGIYVCVAEPASNGDVARAQTVILLKRKSSDDLLEGRESWRGFAACPVIGGSVGESAENGYGGD